ncbi:MAG TPA: PLxRFG domain-containing protein [Ramlibacter sp.]|uniref:PLxRFG domain-containing protein n=1 Tax=Ramlibacter sp. TaxID=1917967 RepID=UPI002D800BB8|nr:PLxRFG domain-containing protein [Ramlibacter sp.]HET8747332.1 PLxRFG domain-containing protein [Ramlibacter sp.]
MSDGLVWSEPPKGDEDSGLVWGTPGGTEANVTGPTSQGWGDVTSGVGRGLRAAGAATLGELFDSDELRRSAGRAAIERELFSERATQGGLPGGLSDVTGPVSAAQLVGRGLVESSPSLALYGAGALTGPVGMGAALAGNLAMRGGENMAARISRGEASNPMESYMYAVPQTALDIGGSAMLLKGGLAGRVAEDVASWGGKGLARTAAGAATEAVEQAGIGGAGAMFGALGQGRDITSHELLEGAVLGGMMGAPFGAVHGLRARAEAINTTPVPDMEQGATNLTHVATAQNFDRPTWERRGGGDIYAYDEAMRQGGQYNLPLREREQRGQRPMDVGAGPLPPERELSGQQLDLFQPRQAGLELVGGAGPRIPPEAPSGPMRPAAELAGMQAGFDFDTPVRRTGTYADQGAIDALARVTGRGGGEPPGAPPALAMPNQMPAPNPNAQLALPSGQRPLPKLPPRAAELMQRQAANEPGRIAQLPERGKPFTLTGQTPEQLRALSKAAEAEANRLELESPVSHAGQRELDLGEPQPAAPSRKQPGQMELLAPTQGGEAPWQQVVRDAYKTASGNMQGIQAFGKVLKAANAEDAAALIREKADDSSATGFSKLDAIHKALTGESLEQHAARTAAPTGEAHAPQTRKEQGSGQPERVGNDAQRVSAEAGGGGKPEPSPKERGKAAKPAEETRPTTKAKDEVKPKEEPKAEETKLPEQGKDTPAQGMDAITMAREQAPENRPGLKRMLDDIEEQFDKHFGKIQRDPKKRREYIETLSHIAHLERDPKAVARAREMLDDFASDAEKEAALKATAEEAALRTSSDVRGEFREAAGKGEGAHDREVFSMAGEGKSAREALEHVAANHPNADVRSLAQKLLDDHDLEHVKLRHGTEAERKAAPADALGESKGDEVLLHSTRDAGQTLVHELAHQATVKALDAGGKAAVEMRRLYAEAQKVQGLAKEYGLKNVKEFVAEAFSNPEFRAKLDAIKAPGGTSLWQRFKAAVARLLGVEKSLLDAVMEAGEGLRREHPAVAHGDGSPNSMYRQATEGGATGRGHAMSDGLAKMYSDAQGTGKSARELVGKINIATMPTHIIAKTYDHILPHLKNLAALMDQRTNRIGDLQRKVIDVTNKIEAARKAAGAKHLERLHQVIGDTQVAGIHPAKAGALDTLRDVRDRAVKDAARAKGDNGVEALKAKEAARKATAAYNAREQWEAMTKHERDALDAAFDALQDMQHERVNALRRIVGEKDSPFFEFRGPYAPLRRYGDWIVSVKSKAMQAAEAELAEARATGDSGAIKAAQEKVSLMNRDPDHRSVHAVENARLAEEKAAQLRSAVGEDSQVHSFTRNDFFKQDTGHRDVLVNDILARLDHEYAGSPDLAALKAMVEDAYIERLPDGSAASMSAHRQLVQGWDQDFSRAIIDRLGRDAFQIGTLEYGKRMAEALKTLDGERREVGSAQASSVYDTMAGRLAHEANYSKFAKAERMVAEATHVFYLGASPAFMLMNMLQTPMMSVPVMAGKFGFGRSMGAATRAVGDVWRLFNRDVGLDVSGAKHLTPEEKLMIGQMENLGLIDLTTAHTSARMARGERIIDPKTGKEKAIAAGQKAKELLNRPVQYIESVNRGGTALAAYRLAREGGVRGRGGAKMGHEAAMAYAADVLRDSHVDYSAQMNPTFLRIPGARVLFQFQKYGLTMFHMLSRTMFDAYGHPKEVARLREQLANKGLPEERRAQLQESLDNFLTRRTEARYVLTGILGMHQLMVGAMGLPFAGLGFSAADIMRNWTGDPEDQVDTRADFQNYLARAFGTDVATLVARGIPAAVLGVDLSRRAGLGDVAPGTQLLTNISRSRAEAGGASDLFAKQLVSLTGPAGGMGQQFFKGMDKIGAGDYVEGAATMMPRAIFHANEAIKQGREGVEIAGKQVHEPLNTSDAFIQFLGLPSTEVERTKEAAYSARALTGRVSLTRSRLIAQAAEARAAGEGMPQEVMQFNERNPGLRITVGDVIKHQRKEAAGGQIKPPRPGSVQAELQRRRETQMEYATDED